MQNIEVIEILKWMKFSLENPNSIEILKQSQITALDLAILGLEENTRLKNCIYVLFDITLDLLLDEKLLEDTE